MSSSSSPTASSAATTTPAVLSTLLQRLDVDAAVDECERLEQAAAARGMGHPYPLEHMICLLLSDDIHEARFLYMRLADDAKKRCDDIWPIVPLLRSGDLIDMATINKILVLSDNKNKIVINDEHDKNITSNNNNNNGPAASSSATTEPASDGLQKAVGELVSRLRNRTLDTLSRAYEVMGTTELKRVLDIDDNVQLRQVCDAHEWKVLQPQQQGNINSAGAGGASSSIDTDGGEEQYIVLAPMPKQGTHEHDQASSSAQIQGLTEQLVRLQT